GPVFFVSLVLSSSLSHLKLQEFTLKEDASPPNLYLSQERGFLPSQSTRPVVGAGEILPEKRKVKTGSNPLHNKR
ncbi:hypothetical protein DY000_02003379, partial [Brassica cretica]